MTKNQIWINLSNNEFQSKKYPNNGHTTGYFKMATGLWFSLPVNSRYASEWGEYIKDDPRFQEKFKNDKGETSVISAQLKETAYIVQLNQWKDVLIEVLQNTSYSLSSEEKRKILLDRIRLETGNQNIEHLLFDIKEQEFRNIEEMYYVQESDEIKKQQRAKDFERVDWKFYNFIRPTPDEDFNRYKNNTLLKIAFLKNLRKMQAIGRIKYEELKEYFTDDDKHEIERSKKRAEKIALVNNEITNVNEKVFNAFIEEELKRYGHLSDEQINMYEQLISSVKSSDEYFDKCRSIADINSMPYVEVTWLTDYFSGCVNERYIQGYDMPSLAIFDTECINVVSQRKEKIFVDSDKRLDDGLLSAKEIGEELGVLSRTGLVHKVESDIVLMAEKRETNRDEFSN